MLTYPRPHMPTYLSQRFPVFVPMNLFLCLRSCPGTPFRLRDKITVLAEFPACLSPFFVVFVSACLLFLPLSISGVPLPVSLIHALPRDTLLLSRLHGPNSVSPPPPPAPQHPLHSLSWLSPTLCPRVTLACRYSLLNCSRCYPRWADVSDQYLNPLFRGFAISFGGDPSASSLTIQQQFQQ